MITETLSSSPRVSPAFALAVSVGSDANGDSPEIRTSIFELLKDSRARFSLVLRRLCVDLGCEHAELWLTHDDLRVGVECGDKSCGCCHTDAGSRLPADELRQFLVYLRRSGGEVCLIEDVRQAAAVWPELEAMGMRGAIAFAVTREGEAVGVIVLVSRQPLDLDGIPAAVLKALGAQIGYVLDRRSSERVLRQSAETFQALFENAPVAYCELDAAGIVTRVNAAYCELLGATPGRLIGQRAWDSVAPKEREIHRELVLHCLQGRQCASPIERTYMHASGAERHTEVHANLLLSADGTVRGARAALVDVTEQWRIEEQRKAMSAMNAVSAEIANTFLEQQSLAESLSKAAAALAGGLNAVAARIWRLDGDSLSLLAAAGPALPRSARLDSVSEWLDEPLQAPPEDADTAIRRAGVCAVLMMRVSSADQPRVLVEVLLRRELEPSLMEAVPVLAHGISLGMAHKLSEAALAASEKKHRQIVETAGEGVWIGDCDGRTTFVNSRMAEMLACDESEAIGCSVLDFVMPEDRQELLAASRRVIAGERASFEVRLRSRQRSAPVWVQVSASPLPQPDGSTGVLAMMTNITSQKCAYEALAESEKKYRRILEHMSEGMMIVGTDRRVTYANEQMAAMLGYTKAEMLGIDALSLLPPENREAALARFLARASGTSPIRERHVTQVLRKDGSLIWCEMSVGTIRDDNGNYQGSFGMATDITATRRAEEALRAAEERFRIAAENASDIIIETDVVSGALQSFGRRIPSGMRSAIEEALASIHPDDQANALPKIRAAWKSGEPADIEFRTISRDGCVQHWSTRSVGVPDEAGVIRRVISVATDVTRQRLAEEQLAASLHLLQRITDTVPAMIYVLDEQLNCTFTNNAWREFVEPDAGWLDSMHPEDRSRHQALKCEMAATHREARNEYRLRRLDGEDRWFMDRALPYYHADGSFGGYIGCAIDITHIKLQERELRKMWQAVEHSPSGVLITDSSGGVEYVNPAFTSITGCAASEVLGQMWPLFKPGNMPERLMKEIRAALEAGQWRGELLNRRKNGEPYWESLAIAPVKDPSGAVTNLVAIEEDISGRKKTEEELRRAEELNRLILESARDGIVVMNQAGEFLYVSGSAQEMGVLNPGFNATFPVWLQRWEDRDGKVADAFRRACSGANATFEGRYRPADRQPRWFDVSLSPITDADGQARRVMAVFRDITERKFTEQQLLQAQKLESIGQLAAGIAHEINTPIQYVRDNGRFLKAAFRDLIEVMDAGGATLEAPPLRLQSLRTEIPLAVEQLLEGVQRVARIVAAMKELSHPGGVGKAWADLNHAVESTATISRNEWKYVADLDLQLDPNLPIVNCHAGEINQVILNLIVNAAHAIAEKQHATGAQDKGKIVVSTRAAGQWAEMRVADTGCGIPESIRNSVFNPFFTTKEVGKGTGQGLAIAHSLIVQKYGGSITFESAVGSGTTFVVKLPVAGAKS